MHDLSELVKHVVGMTFVRQGKESTFHLNLLNIYIYAYTVVLRIDCTIRSLKSSLSFGSITLLSRIQEYGICIFIYFGMYLGQ